MERSNKGSNNESWDFYGRMNVKLFKTVSHTPVVDGVGIGYTKFFVCLNDDEELQMYKGLAAKYTKNDIREIDINNINSITDLYGLSLKDFKRLLDNM